MRAQYDREEVLKQATRLFWQRGFSAASMQQLTEATGLKPGSLYLAFESKEGLFRASMEYYANQSVAVVSKVLDNAPSVGYGICQILNRMVSEAQDQAYCSCFLIKSQLELAATGNELATTASDYLGQMEALYQRYLSREMSETEAEQRAAALMVHIYGIRVYSYLRKPPEVLMQTLESGLPWLPWAEFNSGR